MATTFSGDPSNYAIGSHRVIHGALSATNATGVTATAADPVVFTKTTHGLGTVGTQIRVRCSGFTEMTEINGRDLLCTVTDANTLTALNEDGSGFDAETTGGTLTLYTETDLGYTAPGSTLTVTTEWRERTGDQDGTTPLDDILVGEKVELSLTLMEISAAQWAKVVKPTTVTGTSVEGGGSLAGGTSAYTNAFILWLHPLDADDTDNTAEYCIYKCHPTGPVSTPLDHTQDQALSVTLKGYPDRDRTRGQRMWRFGAAT